MLAKSKQIVLEMEEYAFVKRDKNCLLTRNYLQGILLNSKNKVQNRGHGESRFPRTRGQGGRCAHMRVYTVRVDE